MEELHRASAEAAGEVATLQMQLMNSQSMLQQLQRRNRSLLMDAAAAQAVLELLRGPYVSPLCLLIWVVHPLASTTP
jgi:hypothetical protein